MTPRRTEYDFGPTKHVRLDLPDGTKRMWWQPGGVPMASLPLWNGDLLRESRFQGEPAILVEGEKDADRGVQLGFCCLSLAGGAEQQDFGKALDVLKWWDVVLIPDDDAVGRGLMSRVAIKLSQVGAKSIRLLRLPPTSHDLSNFFDAAADEDPIGARVALKEMIDEAEVIWP